MRVRPSLTPVRLATRPVSPPASLLQSAPARRISAPVPASLSQVRAADASAIPEMPPWFTLEPTQIDLPDNTTALRELGKGRPFPPAIAEQFTKILGRPMTAAGLEKLYAPLLPNCVWVVSDPQLDSGSSNTPDGANDQAKGANFFISALDRSGRIVFESGVAMCRHADGAIEVNNFGADVATDYRGQGITARAELLNERLLRALSAHPNSRFSLSAGSAEDGNTGQAQRGTGTLVHAARGYLFADGVGMESYFSDDPTSPLANPQHPENQATIMAKHFAAWVAQDATLAEDGKPADAALRDALALKAARCKQPWDFLRLAQSGVTAMAVGLHGRPGPMDVGMAFLLSGTAPEWRGVRFVNAPGVAGDPHQAQLRNTSQAVFGVQIKREMESSTQRAEHLTTKLWQDVHSSDAALRTAAYQQLGLHGDKRLQPFLRDQLYGRRVRLLPLLRHRAPETDPQARLALQQALKLMSGVQVLPGLEIAMNRTDITTEVRYRMGNRLEALQESVAAEGTTSLRRSIRGSQAG